MRWLFLCAILGSSTPASARVFDLTRERFASYLLFTGGPSKVGDGAFSDESTAATDYSGSVANNISGEFGFVYATKLVNWRFGFEIMKPATLSAVTAANAAGTTQYQIKSDLTGYIPKVGIEINLKSTPTYRVLAFAYAGQASVTVQNDYSSVAIAPGTDFSSKYKGAANLTGGGLAVEFAGFDTVSVVLEGGYRDLTFSTLTYAADQTSGFGGASHAAGDDATLASTGAKRELNFTGGYIGVGARFWLM